MDMARLLTRSVFTPSMTSGSPFVVGLAVSSSEPNNGRTVDVEETCSGSGSIFFCAIFFSFSLSIFVGCTGGFVANLELHIGGSSPGPAILGLCKTDLELANLGVNAGWMGEVLNVEIGLREERSRGLTPRNMDMASPTEV